jgi:asparagine synthetase B (glutamine-hydrolysing)
MCGIVGVVSKRAYGFVQKDLDCFKELLFADTLRGEDSTGVLSVMKDGDFFIDKDKEYAPYFLSLWDNSKNYKDTLSRGCVLVGHNRKKTSGKVDSESAHPFVVKDRFALVHNGTLFQHHQLANTTVDSEALAIHLEETLNREDVYTQEMMEEALGKVSGAYATCWFNQERDEFQFIRNSQRPLCIAETDDAYFFASEGNLLHWILNRNGVKITKLEIVPEDTLYTFDIHAKGRTPIIQKVTPKKAQPTIYKSGMKMVGNTGITAKFYPKAKNRTVTSVKGGQALSKSEYKRLRAKLMFTLADLYIDDFVESCPFPQSSSPINTEYTVLGEIDSLDAEHLARAKIFLSDFNLTTEEQFAAMIENDVFRGRINDMSYDKTTGTIEVILTSVKRIPSSRQPKTETKHETPIALH